MGAIVAKKWDEKHQILIEKLAEFLENNKKPHAAKLLQKIMSKSNESEVYRNRVISWLDKEASFTDVVNLCSPFAKFTKLGMRNNVFLLNHDKLGIINPD